jgi:nicotinamide-nucleotide amidase
MTALLSSPFAPELLALARAVFDAARAAGFTIAAAESCTGGLVAGLLTEIPGSSAVFERGFVTYSNAAKVECLGVPRSTLEAHGAVSAETAAAMAEGALAHSCADLAVSVTGVAGPDGGTLEKPVGLVWFAVARRSAPARTVERRFPDRGRAAVRMAAVETALTLLEEEIPGRR